MPVGTVGEKVAPLGSGEVAAGDLAREPLPSAHIPGHCAVSATLATTRSPLGANRATGTDPCSMGNGFPRRLRARTSHRVAVPCWPRTAGYPARTRSPGLARWLPGAVLRALIRPGYPTTRPSHPPSRPQTDDRSARSGRKAPQQAAPCRQRPGRVEAALPLLRSPGGGGVARG
jgi:hypothetical protein